MRIQTRLSRQSGVAMLVAMIVITVLSVIAAGFAYSMKVEMRLARNSNNDPTMEWIARSGVELAKYVLALQAQVPGQGNVEALNQKWAGGVGDTNGQLAEISLTDNFLGPGKFSIKIVDAERKFNVNKADQSVLRRAMEIIGSEAGEDTVVIDSILDWLDKDEDNHLSGTESDYYMALDPPYASKNGFIDDLSELLLIRGVTPYLYWGPSSTNHQISTYQSMDKEKRNLRRRNMDDLPPTYTCGLVDLFSAYSAGPININTADENGLQFIPFVVDREMAGQIVSFRSGIDGTPGTEDDVIFTSPQSLTMVPGLALPPQAMQGLQNIIAVRSVTFEVNIEVELDGIKKTYFAVLRKPAGSRQVQTMSFCWK